MISFHYKITDSTNTRAREYAQSNGETPALFVADAQSGGRGRQGKSFFSPADTGIYMSLLFDVTEDSPSGIVAMTSAVSVAVAEAAEAVSGKKCLIKWVNDIYVDGKKVCGILAEMLSAGGRKYVIIGIGINLRTEIFPEDIQQIAGNLCDDLGSDTKEALISAICHGVCEVRQKLADGDYSYMAEYRKRSLVLGKEIVFTQNGASYRGVATGINDNGGLCVTLEDGETRILNSGEISLRLK